MHNNFSYCKDTVKILNLQKNATPWPQGSAIYFGQMPDFYYVFWVWIMSIWYQNTQYLD